MTEKTEKDVQVYFKNIQKAQKEMKGINTEINKELKTNEEYKRMYDDLKYSKKELKKLKQDIVMAKMLEKNDRMNELRMTIMEEKEALDFLIIKEKFGSQQVELPLCFEGATYFPEISLKFIKSN